MRLLSACCAGQGSNGESPARDAADHGGLRQQVEELTKQKADLEKSVELRQERIAELEQEVACLLLAAARQRMARLVAADNCVGKQALRDFCMPSHATPAMHLRTNGNNRNSWLKPTPSNVSLCTKAH